MSEKKELSLSLGDGDAISWKDGETRYCLEIFSDEYPWNPREDDDGNLCTMACFHSRYNLGDSIKDKSPEDFWQRLVRENLSEKEIFSVAQKGELQGIRIEKNKENPELVDVYETVQYRTVIGRTQPEEVLEYEGVCPEMAAQDIIDDLTIGHCKTLLHNIVESLPLWLYDHSGITISCGERVYPYNDMWDSGQVGWILAFKDKLMKETCEYVLDENGERIKEVHHHEGHPDTWSYKTRKLSEDTWRARAKEIMESEVETYDLYLRNEVYGFTLYQETSSDEDDSTEWEEIEAVGGFLGSDIFTSGIADEACGLDKAIADGNYQMGKIKTKTVVVKDFVFN